MAEAASPAADEVRAAEIIAALCLATDLGMGFPLEHGLESTLIAMRLADRLGVDPETAAQTYYGCLLFYIGCTADAEVVAEMFDEGALLEHFAPVMFGTPTQTIIGIMHALAGSGRSRPMRSVSAIGKLPRAVAGHRRHLTALCEVAQMLCDRLAMPSLVRDIFLPLTERWDGKGEPHGLRGDEVPLAVRIMHVARDTAFQRMLHGDDGAARIIEDRAGHAFDPEIARLIANDRKDLLPVRDAESIWDAVLASEPEPWLILRGDAVDTALAAMGDFADLVSPYFVGHASGVASLAATAGAHRGLPDSEIMHVRRAALVHDVGRVAIPAALWLQPGPLNADQWERVRLHAYHTERVLCRSPFLASLASAASSHHERLDGSGYHRGVAAVSLSTTARLLAAADVYHAMIEPRPYRPARSTEEAAAALRDEVSRSRLDGESVAAVLEAAGHAAVRVERPAGLTEREFQVVVLLARGFQTKQIGRRLGISAKTADHHVQNAYAKIGVSTRAAAALYAMEHGLVTWGEVPIPDDPARS